MDSARGRPKLVGNLFADAVEFPSMPDTVPLRRQRVDLASPPLWSEVDFAAGMMGFREDEATILLREQPAVVAAWRPIPDLTSVLSAEPALLYRCGDLAVPLTGPEWAALVGGDLTPAEIGKLVLVFGEAWEWGEHFYTPDSRSPRRPQNFRERLRSVTRS